jgi:hypothetical protein
MNWMKQTEPPSKKSPLPESEKPSAATFIAETYTEQGDGLPVLYTRKIRTGWGNVCDVQIYLSQKYLKVKPAAEIQKYLDRAVAAILTRNGVQQ